MYPVSQEFIDKIKADERQVFAKIQIDYTSPFLDQSISVEANEKANVSFPQQTADSVAEPFGKIASLDGSWVLDGTYAFAPTAQEAETKQMGWWGKQLAGTGGAFSTPYPTLTVSFFPRPITKLQAVGDSKRQEWPVDFNIKLYDGNNTLLHTETVIGNTQIAWSKTLAEPITQVEKMTLEITKWSHAGRQVKILEFFTSIQETYEDDDIIFIHLLEEREVSQGSLPVGNISANEIDIRLNNSNRKFDAGNKQSPLYQLLKQNRRIKAWLGLKGDGDGVNVQQSVDFTQGTLNNLVVVDNKLQLPSVAAPSFSRNSIAYLSDGTLVNTNVPRFELGQFGQAIMVEEGTTNLNSDPFFKTGISGWSIGTMTTMEWLSNVYNPWSKQNGVMRLYDNSLTGYSAKIFSSISTTTYTVKVLLKILKGNINRITCGGVIYYTDSTITDYTWNTLHPTRTLKPEFGENVYELTAIITPTQGKTISRYELRIAHADNNVETELYVYAVQLEAKPYATSFIDGTRSPETLTIPTAGVLNPQEGTVECWVIPQQPDNVSSSIEPSRNDFLWGIPGGTGFLLRRHTGTSPAYSVQIYSPTVTVAKSMNFPVGTPVYIAFRWSSAGCALFINGVLAGSTSSTFTAPTNTMAYLGTRPNFPEGDALYDDLRISSRARTDEEILAAYQSGQPLPVDEWTTYLMRFDSNLNSGQGGYWVSNEYDLLQVGTAATSAISWQEDADGIQRTVYAKLDNQEDWTQVVNGGKLPINPGDVLTGRKLQLKAKLLKVV